MQTTAGNAPHNARKGYAAGTAQPIDYRNHRDEGASNAISSRLQILATHYGLAELSAKLIPGWGEVVGV